MPSAVTAAENFEGERVKGEKAVKIRKAQAISDRGQGAEERCGRNLLASPQEGSSGGARM